MKNTILTLILLIALGNICSAQYNNWNSNNSEKRNAVFVNFGYNYGLTLDVGYNRSLEIVKPVILGFDFSVPMGKNIFDDHKLKIGGEVDLFKYKAIHISAKIKGVIRGYDSEYVQIENFGGDFGLTAGYYKPTWYIAGDFGFDKAITSYLKHSELFKKIYPLLQDGWYTPTGGQFYYGLNSGFSIKDIFDISVKAGLTNAQEDDTNAMLPYYAQLGMTFNF